MPTGLAPEALLFVDGVRRVEARVWIDENSDGDGQATQASAALCASYAAGVVCCCGQQAHLVLADVRRGLFTVAPHASDIVTWAGNYGARHVAGRAAGVPLMVRLSQALQRHLAEVEVVTAVEARAAVHDHGVPAGGDLLVVDGPLRGRQHLPRAVGYIKSHRSTYLPPELNTLVGRAHIRTAHSRIPDGYQLGPAQLVPAATGHARVAMGRRGTHRMLGRPACSRGDPARGREPEAAWEGSPQPPTRMPALPRTSTRSQASSVSSVAVSATRGCCTGHCAWPPTRTERRRWLPDQLDS